MSKHICDHPPWLSLFVGKLSFALQVKIGYNSLWLTMVLDKLWKIITSLLDMLQSWLNWHFLGLDVNISNILQPQNTPWATKGLIGGGGPHIYIELFLPQNPACCFFYYNLFSCVFLQTGYDLNQVNLYLPKLFENLGQLEYEENPTEACEHEYQIIGLISNMGERLPLKQVRESSLVRKVGSIGWKLTCGVRVCNFGKKYLVLWINKCLCWA